MRPSERIGSAPLGERGHVSPATGQLLAGRGRGSRHRTGEPQAGAIRFCQCEIEPCLPLFWADFPETLPYLAEVLARIRSSSSARVPMPDTIGATDDPVRHPDLAA